MNIGPVPDNTEILRRLETQIIPSEGYTAQHHGTVQINGQVVKIFSFEKAQNE